MDPLIIPKQRIKWIDTAKGVCICLVVLHHILASFGLYNNGVISSHIYYSLQSFRIPLYFVLSGLFFKSYGGIPIFIIKKLNKIIVPFAFFYLLLSFIMPWILARLGVDVFDVGNLSFFQIATAFYFKEGLYPNGPIWFLLCLFQVNILFCIIWRINDSKVSLLLFSVLIGAVGLLLSYFSINLYCNLDSALTGIPFFFFGYLVKRTDIISDRKHNIVFVLCFVMISFLFIYFFSRNSEFNFNKFANVLTLYPCGILGSLSVLLLCKCFGKVPMLTFWGHYSLIILSTHYFILDLFRYVLYNTPLDSWWVIFIILMSLYFILVPLLVRFLPYFTAQKDLITWQGKHKD